MGGKADSPASDAVGPGALSELLEQIAREVANGPAPDEAPALWSGAVVERFEILREVGRGGFGVVYEARDRELSRTVAFKVVLPGSKPDLRERRLLEEAEAAARLSHPNIVTLLDVGRCEQGPYLVLEMLRGQTLGARLARGPLPLEEALRIGVEVAKGLSHAHSQGVVHRDLKPGNVFLCDDGQVKVVDFGLAHAFGHRRQVGGTPAYMAPEQASGAPEDERTDVFALGVMLFEMLSGGLPFADARALASQRPAPALEAAGAPALGELVGRMLEKEAVRRPRDGSEVLRALAAEQHELERRASFPARVRVRRRLPWRSTMVIGTLVLAAALAIGISAGLRRPAAPPASDGRAPSVAVLPFTDMSPARDQEYFGDGIAEEIINALTRVEGLQVVGRTSSFSFKGANDDLREVGRKLGAGTVLEGSVRTAGPKVRITVQLVSAATGYHVWSETYDREFSDVLALEDEIARAVVDALRVRLATGSPGSPKPRRAVAPEVYTKYLLGKQLFHRLTWADLNRAAAVFEEAIALDPGYAPAWAALAKATFFISDSLHKGDDIQKGYDRAVAAADRAVALDPELGEAYASRGFLRAILRWDWQGARTDLERALQLNPGDAEFHQIYATNVLRPLGRLPEAIAEAQRATELDPIDAFAWTAYGVECAADGQLERALQAYDRSLEIQPDQAYAVFHRTVALLRLGRRVEARSWVERIKVSFFRLMTEAMLAHSAGRAEESRRALDELIVKHAEGAAYLVAEVFAWRGERDEAFEWLERAYRQRDSGLESVKADPLFQDLRGDPRFAALLGKMGLPVP